MRIEHHLLGLARIGSNVRHAAVAEMDVGDLYSRGHSIDQNDLMVPVELVGFAGIEAERYIGSGRRFPRRLRPTGGIAPHRIVATS